MASKTYNGGECGCPPCFYVNPDPRKQTDMSKFALLISADDPFIEGGGSAYPDAMAFSRALKKFWSFDDSEIVVLSSRGRGDRLATRPNVETHFEAVRSLEDLETLIIGVWGQGIISPHDNKRRYCLADYDVANLRGTTVSLGSLLGAMLRLSAKNSCFICDCRSFGLDGSPWNADDQDCKTLHRYARKTEPGRRLAALTACSVGERPIDLIEGSRGLFTSHLIDGMFDSAKRYQGSFDSVAGYAIQHTARASQEKGQRQFPYLANAGDGDVRFNVTPGFRPDEPFDAYAPDGEEADVPEPLDDAELDAPSTDSEEGAAKNLLERLPDRLPLTLGIASGVMLATAAAYAIYFYFFR